MEAVTATATGTASATRSTVIGELVRRFGADTVRAGALVEVAGLAVERYAPGAPAAVKLEAVNRFASYLADQGTGAIRSYTESDETGPKQSNRNTEYVADHAGAFRRCGCAALLSPYKKRRAGVI